MLNRKHHHKFFCIIVTSNNGGKCLHMKTRQIVGFPKLAFGKYPISDFHENAHYWNYLPILSITPLALFYAKGKFHLKIKKKKCLQILTSAPAVYTTVTVQLHVQTLQDPSAVHATILIQEMEKHAGWWQVNMLRLFFSSRHNFAIIMVFFKFDFC